MFKNIFRVSEDSESYFNYLESYLNDSNISDNSKFKAVCHSLADVLLITRPIANNLFSEMCEMQASHFICCAINCSLNEHYYHGAVSDLRALYDYTSRH